MHFMSVLYDICSPHAKDVSSSPHRSKTNPHASYGRRQPNPYTNTQRNLITPAQLASIPPISRRSRRLYRSPNGSINRLLTRD
jgi:hypothetical protein